MSSVLDTLGNIEGKTPNQRSLVKALRDKNLSLVGVFGPSGTGKTYLTLAQGLYTLARGEYERLIVGRPIVGVTLQEQVSSSRSLETYKLHVREYLFNIASSINPELPSYVAGLIERGRIEIVDPVFMRGRTFDKSFIFIDDIQNTSIEIIVEAITRIGIKSKLVVAGDPVFQHLYPGANRTAVLAWEILRNEKDSYVADLGIKDVIRPGAKRGLRLLLESSLRRRKLEDAEQAVLEAFHMYAPDADIITAINLIEAKKSFNITAQHVPDILVLVKPGHVGRAIGTNGDRIRRVESDTGLQLRVVELTLNFTDYFRAVHPVAWIHKHIVDADLRGPYLVVKVKRNNLGPILGQRGSYARFMEYLFGKLFGVGFRVEEAK